MAALADGQDTKRPEPFRAGARVGWFLVLHLVSAVVALVAYAVLARADGLDPWFRGAYRFLFAHPIVPAVMAFSPLLAVLLVGFGYMQRSRRRKAAALRTRAAPAPERAG